MHLLSLIPGLSSASLSLPSTGSVPGAGAVAVWPSHRLWAGQSYSRSLSYQGLFDANVIAMIDELISHSIACVVTSLCLQCDSSGSSSWNVYWIQMWFFSHHDMSLNTCCYYSFSSCCFFSVQTATFFLFALCLLLPCILLASSSLFSWTQVKLPAAAWTVRRGATTGQGEHLLCTPKCTIDVRQIAWACFLTALFSM